MKKTLLVLTIVSTLITIGIFYPYSTHVNHSLPNSVDPVFYAWNLMHNYTSATEGFRNLLNTNIFYPEENTLALSDTLFAQTLVAAPILAITHNPVLAENLYILATFPLAAVAMFFLCYYLTGSNVASALAGIFYAFSYPRLAQVGHMPAISSQWLPLVFLYLIRWIRERKIRDILLLFLWYLLSITSTMYFGIFLLPLSLIIVAFELQKEHVTKLFRQLIAISMPAIIIIVIVLFPYIRLRAEYPGIRRSLDDAVRLSAVPKDYLSVLPTGWLSDIGLPTETNERPLYPTLALVTLALASLLIVKSRKVIIEFFLIATSAFALSFGPRIGTINLPYYYLYKVFPLLESIRVPARFSIFVILGLSVCAAFTLTQLLRHKNTIAATPVILLLFLLEIWQINIPYVRVPTWNEAPSAYPMLKNMPDDGILVELPLRPEWSGVRMENQLMLPYDSLEENDVYALEAYRTYFSAFHRKRMLNGYSGYFPNVYHDHSIVLDTFPSEESIVLLTKKHVRYILVHSREYTNRPFEDIRAGIEKFPQLKLIGQFENDYLYTL